FPGETAARSWLDRPQVGLEGAVPLEFARSELGARVVEELMLRIHRGILA
ncbi:MAG: antitoxin Xre/MbcA/ParS toxin-binding domain-containing protein, partial [Opitutaceae bacterium]